MLCRLQSIVMKGLVNSNFQPLYLLLMKFNFKKLLSTFHQYAILIQQIRAQLAQLIIKPEKKEFMNATRAHEYSSQSMWESFGQTFPSLTKVFIKINLD